MSVEQGLFWTGSPALIGGVLALGGLALVLSLRERRTRPTAWVEGALWLGALGGIVLSIARPIWIDASGRSEGGVQVVLVDASRSMSLVEGGESRLQTALALAQGIEGARVFGFGADLTPGLPEHAERGWTDLQAAIDAVRERYLGEQLIGLTLITDGLDRGPIRSGFLANGAIQALDLPGPLTVYQVGTGEGLSDVSIEQVELGGFAFKNEDFVITVRVRAQGWTEPSVRVQLEREGKPVASKRVSVDDEGVAEVRFTVRPTEVGRVIYTVSVPHYEGDAISSNDRWPVAVRVMRDAISVLQVTGTPSWDVKFLRRFLKEDPSVDLVSFFILRTEDDLAVDYREEELALIAFPYQELFTTELDRFDLVIFQNFDYAPFFRRDAERLLGNIRQFVEGGKAFVMLGGDRSFDLGAYKGSPIDAILPVDLGFSPDNSVSYESVRPVLTPQGRRHPVTRLVEDAEENAIWWERLHAADGVNRVGDLRPESVALLVHPTERTASGQPMPIVSVREVGEGRTLALTSDASWRWSLSEAAEGRGNQAYLRFWKGAFRWLLKDPSVSRVRVQPDRENVALGSPVSIQVNAKDAGFSPQPGAPVELTVHGPSETTVLKGTTDERGQAQFELLPTERGAYRLQADVRWQGQRIGLAKSVFAVSSRDPELEQVQPDGAFLRALVESTGGRFYGPGESGPPLVNPQASRTVWDREELALWRDPRLGLWIVLCSGLAWWVRRRSGLR